MKAFPVGDMVTDRREQARAWDFITIVHRHGGLAACKVVMKFVGVDCGPVRLPLRQPTAEMEHWLRHDLERVGFSEYCCKLS